jgi:hypothetical protein
MQYFINILYAHVTLSTKNKKLIDLNSIEADFVSFTNQDSCFVLCSCQQDDPRSGSDLFSDSGRFWPFLLPI